MCKTTLLAVSLFSWMQCFCWGFYGHRKINQQAVYGLPPSMLVLYKPHLEFLTDHAVDPDKRRYVMEEEGPRHYIDLDHYGPFPFDSLPRKWEAAVEKFGEDSLTAHGIVPWWIQVIQRRLTRAFAEKDAARILKLSADLGHYLADAHVPLHATSNHNGQQTGQRGIHGFWESRVPELLAEKSWNFWIGKAEYIADPGRYIWQRVMESAAAADTVLMLERKLTSQFPPDRKYAFENRDGQLVRQYSRAFTMAYNHLLAGMIERRMRQSIHAVASFWFTAWIDAGQPDLLPLARHTLSPTNKKDIDLLNQAWRSGKIKGREE